MNTLEDAFIKIGYEEEKALGITQTNEPSSTETLAIPSSIGKSKIVLLYVLM